MQNAVQGYEFGLIERVGYVCYVNYVTDSDPGIGNPSILESCQDRSVSFTKDLMDFYGSGFLILII